MKDERAKLIAHLQRRELELQADIAGARKRLDLLHDSLVHWCRELVEVGELIALIRDELVDVKDE